MKTKIGINSRAIRPQQYARKDPHPELPFEGSGENTALWQFGLIVIGLLILAEGYGGRSL